MDTVNAQQQGTDQLLNVIVPRSNFSCNGRITGYMVSLNRSTDADNNDQCTNPRILILRPLDREGQEP